MGKGGQSPISLLCNYIVAQVTEKFISHTKPKVGPWPIGPPKNTMGHHHLHYYKPEILLRNYEIVVM